MRNRTLSVASALAASVVSLALFACSGASSQDVTADDADAGATGATPGAGSGSTTGSPSGSGSTSTGSTDPGTGTTLPGSGSGSGSADAGTGSPMPSGDAGEAPKDDAGALADGGIGKPTPGGPGDGGTLPITCKGTVEKEPNDKPADATPFTSSICGELKPKDDVDNASFALAADAKRIDATYTSTGPVTFKVTVKGTTLEILGPGSPAIPFFPGESYVFEASSKSPKPVAYELFVKTQ